jgi:hypothetical protein
MFHKVPIDLTEKNLFDRNYAEGQWYIANIREQTIFPGQTSKQFADLSSCLFNEA